MAAGYLLKPLHGSEERLGVRDLAGRQGPPVRVRGREGVAGPGADSQDRGQRDIPGAAGRLRQKFAPCATRAGVKREGAAGKIPETQ